MTKFVAKQPRLFSFFYSFYFSSYFFLFKIGYPHPFISTGTINKEKANNHYFMWNNRVLSKKTKRRSIVNTNLLYKYFFFLLVLRSWRVDPADKNGVHLVNQEDGGNSIYIRFDDIDDVIDELKEVKS